MAMDDNALIAWGHYLADIDAGTLREIVDAWVASEPRPPSIADIRNRLAGLGGTDAESAWQRARTMLMHGQFRGPDRRELPFGWSGDERMEHAVKAAGGWVNLGQMDEKQLTWAKKEFVEAYGAAGQRAQTVAALGGGREEIAVGEAPPPQRRPVRQSMDPRPMLAATREAIKRGADPDELERLARAALAVR